MRVGANFNESSSGNKLKRIRENLFIKDEDWKGIIEGAQKAIESNPVLLNRFNQGEVLTYEVPTVNEEGKDETLALKLSKPRVLSCGFCERELKENDMTISFKGLGEVFCSLQCAHKRVAKLLKVPTESVRLPPISFSREETPETKVVVEFPEEMKLVLPRLRTRTTTRIDTTGRKVIEEGVIEDEGIKVKEGVIEEFPKVEGRKYYFKCSECLEGFEAEEPKITFSFGKEQHKFCSEKCFLKALSRKFKQIRLEKD